MDELPSITFLSGLVRMKRFLQLSFKIHKFSSHRYPVYRPFASQPTIALGILENSGFPQPRPQGLLLDDFQNGGSSGEDPGTQQKSRDRFVHVGWKFIQNGGHDKE